MKPILQITTESATETRALAGRMAGDARPGGIVALCGELGVGKTVFAQGFAAGLGYDGPVTSPTFTLMNIYEGGRLPLYHFDLYRLLDGAEGLEGIGYEDYFFGDGVALVEWAERAEELLPGDATVVTIERTEDGDADAEGNRRLITVGAMDAVDA